MPLSETLSKPMFSNRQLYTLIWPLVIEQLLNVLVGMVDVVMVASIGEAAVSGVSLVDSLNQLLIQFLAAMTTGGTVVCAQYIGMRDLKKAGKTSGQLIMLTILSISAVSVGFLLSGRHLLKLMFGQVEADVMENAYIYFMITACSFPFLALYNSCAALFRAVGNSGISMKMSMFMNGLNIAGNALCIFVLKMGVAGVAVPTLLARATASVLLFWLLQRSKAGIRVAGIDDLRPDGYLIRRILSIGIPGGIENSLFQLGKVMLQSLVSTLGTAAIAGYAVAGNLVMFLYLPGNALGLATTTVVGQCVGAGEAEQAKHYAKKFVMLDYSFLAVVATGLALLRFPLIGIYSLSPESAAVAGGLILSHCLAMPLWPPAFVMPYAFRASGDVRYNMIVSLACMWIFRVALAYLFVRVLGLSIQFVWYAMYIDWVFRMSAYLWRFRGFADRIRRLKI